MRTWIKSPLGILTEDPENVKNGIVINNNIIEELLNSQSSPGNQVDHIIDASELVVIPGLVNSHHHYYQTLTRSVPQALDKSLFPWLQSLYPVWSGLTEEMVYSSTRLACAELLLSGCTTSADHHYLFPSDSPNLIDAQVQAVKDIGIRSTLTRGCMSLGKNEGGLPPDHTIQSSDEILSDCERLIAQYHNPSSDSMLQIALAPCSPFSVTKSLMMDIAHLARQYNVRLHTHLAESNDEEHYCQEKFGQTPLEYLESVQWLDNDVWLAHGIHFSKDEILKLGAAKIGITHCPSSNMLLGSGCCKVNLLRQCGVAVGLGVDGSASNDGSNMMQEVRQAFLLQRLFEGADRFSHFDALELATTGSAACLGRNRIGKISTGMIADLSLYKLDEPRFSGAADPIAALVLSGAHRADQVMVNGNWIVKNGALQTIDLAALKTEHSSLSRKLLSKNA